MDIKFDLDKVRRSCNSEGEAAIAAKAIDQKIGQRTAIDKIQIAFTQELNELTIQTEAELDELKRDRSLQTPHFDPDLIDKSRKDLAAAVTNLNAELAPEKTSLLDERKTQFVDLNAFRMQNGLVRNAVEPGNEPLHWGIMLAILLGETILNAGFFAQTNQLGFFGGIFEAGMFAAINVGFAIAFAFWVRYINHRGIGQQISGWSGLLIYLLVLFFYNCFVGHYRNALGDALQSGNLQGVLQAAEIAIGAWRDNPVAIGDVQSVILAIIGGLMGLAAFAKTYFFGDVYPGYGSQQKRYTTSGEALTEFRNEREQAGLNQIYGNSIEALSLEGNDKQNSLNQFATSLKQSKSTERSLKNEIASAKNLFKAELNVFRMTYQKLAAQDLASDIDLEGIVADLKPTTQMPDVDLADEEAKYEEIKPLVDKLVSDLQIERNKRSSDRETKMNDLQNLWNAEDANFVKLSDATS